MHELEPKYPRLAFWGSVVLSAFLLAVIHWPALTAEIQQPELQIFQNPMVLGVGMGASPVSPFTAQIGATGLAFYRPLTTLSYRIGYSMGGANPFVHRLVNLLIVLLTGIILFQLLWLLTRDTPVTIATVALYLVHPVAAVVPSMVAGREDLLLMLFIMLAWKLHLDAHSDSDAPGNLRKLMLSGLAYLAALLSSEKAILFLGLVLLGDITVRAAWHAGSAAVSGRTLARRRFLPAYGSIIGISAVFFLWKYWVIGVRPWSIVGKIEALDNPLVYQSTMSSLGNALKLAGVYLSKCLWQVPPMGDLYEYIPLASPADLTLLIFIAFAILVSILAVLKFRRIPLAFMPAWIFGLGIIPALNLFYTTPDAIADQHMYLPALGIALGIALLAGYLRTGRNFNRLLALVAGIVVVLFLGTIDTIHSFRLSTERGWLISMQSFAPYNVKVQSKLAQYLKGTDLMPQMNQALEELARMRPDSVQVRVELGRIKASSGDLASATKILTEAKGLDSQNPEPFLVLGNVYEGAGQDAAAIQEYESALKIQPKLARALGLLGVAYQRSRQTGKAMEYYKQALELNPGSGSSYVNMCATMAQDDQYREAMFYCERGLQLDPTLAEGYLNLGSAYLRLNRQDDAIATFDSAIALFGDNPAVMVRAGLFFQQMQNFDKSAAIFKAALATNPNNLGLLLALGNTYRGAGDIQQALTQYSKVLELNPKSVDAYLGIGNAQGAAGKTAQALEAFQKAAELSPDNAAILFNIGNTHRGAGQYEAAESAYLKALQLQPDYAQACFNLAATYESMKKPVEAIRYYEEFLKYWKGESVVADNAQAHIEQLRSKPAKP